MSFINGPVFTTAGKALHARAIAGATLKFTTMQLGDGSLGSVAISDLTALVHTVTSVDITTLRHRGDFATVSGMFTNSDLTTGFYWREIGLFAADPDAPNDRSRDILYCYQNAGSMADYIPASDSELITKRINIAAIVSDAAQVSAVLASETTADAVTFDNTNVDLEAEDVQAAIEEIVSIIQELADSDEDESYTKDQTDELLAQKADLGSDGKVKSDQLPEISSAKYTHITLTTSGWAEGADGRFYQTVSVPDVAADTKVVVVDVDLSTNDADAKIAYLEAWAHPAANEVTQGNGTLTFYAWEQPTSNIPVNVGVM